VINSLRSVRREKVKERTREIKSYTLGVSGLGGGRRVAPGRRPEAVGAPQQARVWAVEAAVRDPETM